MQPKVSKLVNYVRNPTWISINFCADKTKDGQNFAYTEEERRRFREDPQALFAVRRELEASIDGFFYGMLRDNPPGRRPNPLQAADGGAHEGHPGRVDRGENDPLIPAWLPPSDARRRLSRGIPPAQRAHVLGADRAITATGIRTADGAEEQFDLIVCATDFDTSFIPPWKLVGRDGAVLDERWKENPEAFFAVQVDGMPNYFMFNGPNCPISHGSVLTQVSFTSDYILRWARKMATEDIASIAVKKEAVDDYNVWAQEFLERTVWADECRSSYKNGKNRGQLTGVYPGSLLHFKECLERIGGEHFDIRYHSPNRFRCPGNGQTVGERCGGGRRVISPIIWRI